MEEEGKIHESRKKEIMAMFQDPGRRSGGPYHISEIIQKHLDKSK